jgi:IS5 family transposase
VADIAQTHALLHGEEEVAFGDAGYQGVEKRVEIVARFAAVRWHVAAKRGKVKAMAESKLKEATQALEKAKAQVRAYFEHPFHVVKNLFRHRKTRYRGLAKNTAQLHTLFALANLVLVQRNLRPEART